MDKLLIRGGRTLQGEVLVSGAKNAALPELCAALLTADPVTLLNVPQLQDVSTMLKLIRNMGVTADRSDDGTVRIDASANGFGQGHVYLWAEDGERETVAAVHLAGKGDSGFMTPAQSGETAATFDAMVELMLEGADDPQFTPRNQLDRIQERGHAAQEN